TSAQHWCPSRPATRRRPRAISDHTEAVTMGNATQWHRLRLVTSDAEATLAAETFRQSAGWLYVPLPPLRKVLYDWFRRGWCLAAIQRAWEVTPSGQHQGQGDPDADP